MASLIGSIRNIKGDPWWFFKISFFACVLFFFQYNAPYMPQDAFISVYAVTYVLLIGSCNIAMHRNINNLEPILPSFFTIHEVILKSIGSIIVMLPGCLLYYYCMDYVQTNISLRIELMRFIYISISLIFMPFIFIPFVLYSVNGKLLNAFKIKTIIDSSGNFIVQMLSYLIQWVVIMCGFTLIVYFALLEMLGDNEALLVLKCYFIVISLFSIFLYMSDLYGDYNCIPEINKKSDD